jgi:hypothetical protein
VARPGDALLPKYHFQVYMVMNSTQHYSSKPLHPSQVTPLGQMYAHFSHVANTAQSAAVLDFDSDPLLELRFAGRSHVAQAQGAVFDYGAARGKCLVVLVRNNASESTTLDLSGVAGLGDLHNSTFYDAASTGAPSGWSAYPLDTLETQPFPWPGPITPESSCVTSTGASSGPKQMSLSCGQGLYYAYFV